MRLRAAVRDNRPGVEPSDREGARMGVINTIDLEGVSSESWGDAAREALREAAKTIRHIRKMDVVDTACRIRDSAIVEYRTQVKIYFEVEPSP